MWIVHIKVGHTCRNDQRFGKGRGKEKSYIEGKKSKTKKRTGGASRKKGLGSFVISPSMEKVWVILEFLGRGRETSSLKVS